jgi:digeranylgeranylglycerophospholipid reductase
VGFAGDGSVLLGGNGRGSVRARVVIGADGPISRVAKAARLGRPDLMLAMQRVVRLRKPCGSAHLYFWRTCMHGYGWLFPKEDKANLGVSVAWRRPDLARTGLRELVGRLEAEGVVEAGPPISRCTGLVPAGGPLERTALGSVLLAGDAAGHVDPLTGAGIANAVRCGRIAGQTAADHVSGCLPGGPAEAYEQSWRKILGGFFSRSMQRRDGMRSMWDTDLDGAVRAAWIDRKVKDDGGS